MDGKIAVLREMLEQLAEVGDDILPGRISKFELETGYDPTQDNSLSEDRARFYERPEQPDEHLTGERVQTPSGSFSLTNLTKEQMQAAGYGVHHESDDRKYLIMGNGARAFVVLREPEREKDNLLKNAEMRMEDDYGMVDGIINNGIREETKEKPSSVNGLPKQNGNLPNAHRPKRRVGQKQEMAAGMVVLHRRKRQTAI